MSLSEITISDKSLSVDVIEACTEFTIDLQTSGQTQITMTFADPGFKMLAANIFQRKQLFKWNDLWCEIAVVETGDNPKPNGIKVQARSYGVQRFKRNKDALVRSNISPSEWLAAEASLLGIGAVVYAQPCAKRSQIARVNTTNQQQSTWDVMTTMAGELGYEFFECANAFYFGQPSWLIQASTKWTITWPSSDDDPNNPSVISVPACRSSENAKSAATVTLVVDHEFGRLMRPGHPVAFSGVPQFEGTYMISGVSWDELHPNQPVTVQMTTPIDPEKKGATPAREFTESDGPAMLINGTALAAWSTA